MNNKVDNKWHWEGSIWDFIGIVQWAFVFHKVGKEQPEDWTSIVRDPEKVRSQAKEYGMDEMTIASEMVRIGQDAKRVCQCIHNSNDQENEET